MHGAQYSQKYTLVDAEQGLYLHSVLNPSPLQDLDVFMAGDDVPNKKPDPSIYRIAAERLKVDPKECFVIEDSTIGLKVIPFPCTP